MLLIAENLRFGYVAESNSHVPANSFILGAVDTTDALIATLCHTTLDHLLGSIWFGGNLSSSAPDVKDNKCAMNFGLHSGIAVGIEVIAWLLQNLLNGYGDNGGFACR